MNPLENLEGENVIKQLKIVFDYSLVLEMLNRAETFELACNHDGDSGAQSFAFIHVV
jgi:hypothetical protein